MAVRPLGYLAIVVVVLIYAVTLIGTRYGVTHGLSALDLVALRYATAGVLLAPAIVRLGWRDLGGLGWRRGIALVLLGGAPYMVVFSFGLELAPAAHAAVLNSGIVPSVVFLGLVALGRQRFSPVRALALLAIIVGLALVTGSSFAVRGPVLLGDAVLLATGISWGLFTLFARLWDLRPWQLAAVVSLLSLLYLPFYAVFAYDGFAGATLVNVAAQAAMQGVLAAIVAMALLAVAVQRLGAQTAALFSPLVPILTALLAVPLLGETLVARQWAGVAIVALGMLGAAARD